MAFSDGVPPGAKSSRRPKSGSGVSRKIFYATAALGAGVVVTVWLAATAATMQSVASSVSPARDIRPRIAVLAKPPAPFDPRVLIVAQPDVAAAARLNPDALAAYWNNRPAPAGEAEGASLVLAELPAAVTTAVAVASVAKSARPGREGMRSAIESGRLDILRRAMAAAGTDVGRTARLAFAPPADAASLKVVAALGAPLPAPEASIEIAFMADLLDKPDAATEVAKAENGIPAPVATPTAAASVARAEQAPAKPVETEVASLENPFEEVLATPESVPLPAAKPSAPTKTIPMKAKSEPTPEQAPKSLLAYARPNNPLDSDESPSLFGKRQALPGRGSRIAVYDISAGVVHMPNGEKLKAHSGRGNMRDDPRFVHVKNRGPTPPNVYSLRMRESRFHGVEAIRMNPVGDAKMFGRDGFLTHTYLLRRRGDSSGCVVFEDYNRFLTAFKRGNVKTLVVVPRISELSKYMAML